MRIPKNYEKFLEKSYLEEKRLGVGLFHLDNPFYYGHGYFLDKLSGRDVEIIGLIRDLNENSFNIEEFRTFIASLERGKKARELQCLIDFINDYQEIGRMEEIPSTDLESKLAYLENLDFEKFSESCKSIYTSQYSNKIRFNFTSDEYVALCALQLMCQLHFQLTLRFLVPKDNSLEKIYLHKGLLLDDIDPQYSKYRLLTIDENFTISDNYVSKVYDRRIEEDVFINEISHRLMALFKRLMEQDFIGSIALRPEYSLSGLGVAKLSILLDEVEIGERFSFEKLGLSSVAKLYSKKYDNLWVVIDYKSIGALKYQVQRFWMIMLHGENLQAIEY